VRQIVVGTWISGIAPLGLALWLVLLDVGQDANAIALLVSSLIFGVGVALLSPAQQSLLPLLVRVNELPTAVGLNFVPMTIARSAGPALGALALDTLGSVYTLLIIGSATLLVIPCFRLVQHRLLQEVTGSSDYRILTALRFVWSKKSLLACLVGIGAIGAGSEAAVTLSPVVASSLNAPGSGGGALTAAYGLGGFVGFIVHRIVQKKGTPGVNGCIAMIVLGVAIGVAPLAGSLPFAIGALAVGGAGMVGGVTAFSIAVHFGTPPELLGRVMALWTLTFSGFRPPAAIALGLAADHFSTATALLGAGLFVVDAGCAVWIAHRRNLPTTY
jgi:MFS family permease